MLEVARRQFSALNVGEAQLTAFALFVFLSLAFIILFAADYGADPPVVVFMSLLVLSLALRLSGGQ